MVSTGSWTVSTADTLQMIYTLSQSTVCCLPVVYLILIIHFGSTLPVYAHSFPNAISKFNVTEKENPLLPRGKTY